MRNFLIIAAVAGLLIAGCGHKDGATAQSDTLPASLFVTAPPQAPLDIGAAKKSAKDGESIVLRGRIGGQREPLAANRAVMTLADLSLPTCDKTPMKSCDTPWDSCCEPSDVVAAHSVTVQVSRPDGKPLKIGLNGEHGIKPGKEVVVAGTARRLGDENSLTIDVKQIFVEN